MIKTLLLFDGKMSSAERAAGQLCYLIGHAKAAEIDEAPEDLTPYGGVCFVFNYYGSVTTGKLKSALAAMSGKLADKRLAMVGIGYSDLGYTKYVVDTEEETGLKDIAAIFIGSEKETTRAGYELGKLMRLPAKPMSEEMLMDAVRAYVGEKGTLALATSTSGYIRCTPLEYLYLDDVFYIATKGGMKFRGILDNGRVCASIFRTDEDGKVEKNLQFLADAETVPVGSAEYKVAMTARHITEEALALMPVTVFLVRITPLRYEFFNRDFEREGYDVSQALDTKQQKQHRREARERIVSEQTKGQPTMTIRGADGEEKQVTIPEVSISFLQPFDPADRVTFSGDAGRKAVQPEGGAGSGGEKAALTEEEKRRRKELLLKKKKRKAALRKREAEAAEKEAGADSEKRAAAEGRTASGAKPKQKEDAQRAKRGVFTRLGDGLGRMLTLDDEEE